MLLKKPPYYIMLLFLIVFTSRASAQVEVLLKNPLEKIKDGHTHVIVDDVNSAESQDFLMVYKKYWKLTKGVDMVTVNNLKGNWVAGDSYFSLQSTFFRDTKGATNMYYYLTLWTPTDKTVKKNKDYDPNKEISIARIEFAAHGTSGEQLRLSFGDKVEINNWHPGLLKNYLQQLTVALETDKKVKPWDAVTDKEQLALLKDGTLYCPEDNLYTLSMGGKSGKFTDTEVEELFSGYKAKYKVISDNDLSEKILNDKEQFYYLIFLNNTPYTLGRTLVVVNSRTGEIIYRYTHVSFTFNLKASFLKDLYKEAAKN